MKIIWESGDTHWNWIKILIVGNLSRLTEIECAEDIPKEICEKIKREYLLEKEVL